MFQRMNDFDQIAFKINWLYMIHLQQEFINFLLFLIIKSTEMLTKNSQHSHHLQKNFHKDPDPIFFSFQQLKGKEVFVSLKKSSHPISIKNQSTHQNTYEPINKQKPFHQKDQRKTIESTIKQLLKGKHELASYLESQKQFIQVLDVHDQEVLNRYHNRGKLASSLTEKKRSRIETYTAQKNNIRSNFYKVSKMNNKIFIQKNEALTMQVMKNQGDSLEKKTKAILQKRHYQTVSFNEINSKDNQRRSILKNTNSKNRRKNNKNSQTRQNQFKDVSKQNLLPSSQQCFVMTSPERRSLKLNERQKYEHNSFNGTKYGLTQFSPWAFPKNEFDVQLGQNSSHIEQKIRNDEAVFRQRTNNCQEKSIKNQGKTFLKKLLESSKKEKAKILQVQIVYEKIKNELKDKQNIKNHTFDSKTEKDQNTQIKSRYLSLQPRKQIDLMSNEGSSLKIVKSSQVMVLQSQMQRTQQIFASKEQAKQMFYPRKSLKYKSSQTKGHSTSIEAKPHDKKLDLNEKEKLQNCQRIKQFGKCEQDFFFSEIIKQSQLEEIKKTQQFLKDIILSKNSVSFSNSRSISKKQLKKSTQAVYEEKIQKKSNVFITKDIFGKKNQFEKSPQKIESNSFFENDKLKTIDKNIFKTQSKIRESQNNKEFSSADGYDCKKNQQEKKKKAKTSLDNRMSENQIDEFPTKQQTTCMTQAALNGFQLINESKIRNTKNSFIRRKRHSMTVKNRNGQKSQKEGNKRRVWQSIDRQGVMGRIYEMRILQQSKGLGIVNPLTKQLYKKYVSIVQSRR